MIHSHPVNTYRLQLHAGFGFSAARELVPYFADLGITHLYLSPIWTARPGSVHGYDICDPAAINPELGGEEGFALLSDTAASNGLGLLLDFVPNHMCADPSRNLIWREMLRNGPSSPSAEYFDIDWQPVKKELQYKVLLPILGKPYGDVLDSGELRVVFADGEFSLRYWDHDLPLNPRQNLLLLRHRVNELRDALADDEEAQLEYLSILFQLEHLPPYTEISAEAREDRLREVAIANQRLRRILEQNDIVRRHVDRNIEEFNGWPGDGHSFDLLHELLERQVYRLGYWRTALHEINYRRFFDINELTGLRMESPAVFEAAHTKVFALLRAGRAHGMRLDHIDGLYDPSSYLHQLRSALDGEVPGTYISVEKILSGTEPLNPEWPVDGTTGYEYLNELNRLYVQPVNMGAIRRTYQRFSRRQTRFEDVIYTSKRQIIATSMASELHVLAHELNRISEQNRRHRDFTLDSLREALREITACFPVYRTYISERGATDADRAAIDEAISRAIARNPAMESSIFAFVRDCLCPAPGESRRLRFAMKFQQYTGPVQAKGIEDTAFYRYCPLASLNEVGGEPSRLGEPLEEFHAANLHRQRHHPRSMITTSTHDTKRGEDARARINVLSEMPRAWDRHLRQWSRLTRDAKTRIGDRTAPDHNDEYLFFQSLLAIWPAGAEAADARLVERLQAYMAKAIKEAKIHSSWINPSNEYDDAVSRFVEEVLTGRRAEAFLASFLPFARRVIQLGTLNSLSQLALKLGSPGVADFYQGTEGWDLTLVDPDNRQPVDYAALQRQAGEGKPLVTRLGARFRRDHAELFEQGRYVRLDAAGPLAEHVVAFARIRGEEAILAAGLRWMSPLVGAEEDLTHAAPRWDSTTVPLPGPLAGRPLHNVLTGETLPAGDRVPLARLFRSLPGAMLAPTGE